MFSKQAFLTVLSFATLHVSQAAYTDPVCVDTCSDWSVVLGHCRAVYGDNPGAQNLTFANSFVNCCCVGEENDVTLGRDESLKSVGICQACNSTPAVVRKDLALLLELCTIQANNRTAGDAPLFKPQGYATSEDRTKAGSSLDNVSAAAPMAVASLLGTAGVMIAGFAISWA